MPSNPDKHEPTVLARNLVFPEGPAFSDNSVLWGVEMNAGRLFRWADGDLTRLDVGGRPNGLTIWNGEIFVADAGRDSVYQLASRWHEPVRLKTIVDSAPGRTLAAPNDLIFDANGVMIFTCPGDPKAGPVGAVWARAVDGRLARLAEQMNFPNGLALTPDGRDLIVAETLGQRLWRGRWDSASLAWRDAEPWAEVGGAPLGPDGMAFGPDGLLYVALYGSGLVKALDEDGRTVVSIDVPGPKPTNLAFDPSGRLGMVITEAVNGLLLSYPGVGRSE